MGRSLTANTKLGRHAPTWVDAFVHEYECAFTSKAGAAMLTTNAKYCNLCHTADHNAGDEGCIFRAPKLTGGANHQAGKLTGATKPGKTGGGGGASCPNRAPLAAGDQLRGKWFSKIGGKKVCIAWNTNNPNEPCASPCAKGFEHVCSYCKGSHRSANCPKYKLDFP